MGVANSATARSSGPRGGRAFLGRVGWIEAERHPVLLRVAAATTQRRLAALSLGSSQEGVYSEKDLRLLHRVAELVALAVENALLYGALQLERRRLQMLLEVNNTLVTNLDIQ